MERVPTVSGTANLLDILDRIPDKGQVIAGDVRVRRCRLTGLISRPQWAGGEKAEPLEVVETGRPTRTPARRVARR